MGEPLLNRHDRQFIQQQVDNLTDAIEELTEAIEDSNLE